VRRSADQLFLKRKRLTLKLLFFFTVTLFLDCRLTGALSATLIEANCASPSPEDITELPIPASELTTSKSAAKIASLSEIREFRCLVNLNIIVSRVKFTELVIGCCSEV
jgi:hypothetical protein